MRLLRIRAGLAGDVLEWSNNQPLAAEPPAAAPALSSAADATDTGTGDVDVLRRLTLAVCGASSWAMHRISDSIIACSSSCSCCAAHVTQQQQDHGGVAPSVNGEHESVI